MWALLKLSLPQIYRRRLTLWNDELCSNLPIQKIRLLQSIDYSYTAQVWALISYAQFHGKILFLFLQSTREGQNFNFSLKIYPVRLMFVQTLTIDKLLCTFYVIFIHYAKLILTRKLIYEYVTIKKVLPVAQKKTFISVSYKTRHFCYNAICHITYLSLRNKCHIMIDNILSRILPQRHFLYLLIWCCVFPK